MSGQLVVPPGARLKTCAWPWQGTINTMTVILQGNVKEMQWSFVQFMVFIIIYMYLCSSLHFEASQVGSRLKVRRIWNGPAFSSQTSRYKHILFEHFQFKFHDIPEYPGKSFGFQHLQLKATGSGGETEFASSRAAYEAFPQKATVDGLICVLATKRLPNGKASHWQYIYIHILLLFIHILLLLLYNTWYIT